MFNLNDYRSTLFQLYSELYRGGTYHIPDLRRFVSWGTLTKEGYQEIVGEPYDQTTQGVDQQVSASQR